jgi:hypothetical protein
VRTTSRGLYLKPVDTGSRARAMITTFELSLDATDEEVGLAASAQNLQAKSWNELVWTFEALRRWKDVLETRFGDLTQVDHRSPPDDPPDLMLHFGPTAVQLEHTLLKPYPLGWADAIRGNRGGFVPPVTTKSWTRAELQKLISGIDDVWGDASETLAATFNEFTSAVAKKVQRLPPGGIVVVDDRATHDSHEREILIKGLRAESKSHLQHTIILFQRNNPLQFWSALLTADELLIRQSDV